MFVQIGLATETLRAANLFGIRAFVWFEASVRSEVICEVVHLLVGSDTVLISAIHNVAISFDDRLVVPEYLEMGFLKALYKIVVLEEG